MLLKTDNGGGSAETNPLMSGLFVLVDFSLGCVCSFPYVTKPAAFLFLVVPKNVKLQTRPPSTHEQAASCPQPKIG